MLEGSCIDEETRHGHANNITWKSPHAIPYISPVFDSPLGCLKPFRNSLGHILAEGWYVNYKHIVDNTIMHRDRTIRFKECNSLKPKFWM